MRFIILIFSLSALAGCVVGNLQQLEFLAPEANGFSSSLAAEYLAYAKSEEEMGHSLVAEHFAAKGLKAWKEEEVPLEEVDDSMPEPQKSQLQSVRSVLNVLLAEDVKRVIPQKAARAQLLFDCWARQTDTLDEDIAPCDDELAVALTPLQAVAADLGLIHTEKRTIRFATGSAKLPRSGFSKLRELAKASQGKTYMIDIDGTPGDEQAKLLFARRVAEITHALGEMGVPVAHIRFKELPSEKTVYLSADDTIKDSRIIQLTLTTFHAAGSNLREHVAP